MGTVVSSFLHVADTGMAHHHHDSHKAKSNENLDYFVSLTLKSQFFPLCTFIFIYILNIQYIQTLYLQTHFIIHVFMEN